MVFERKLIGLIFLQMYIRFLLSNKYPNGSYILYDGLGITHPPTEF